MMPRASDCASNFLLGKNSRMSSNPIGLFGGPLGYSGTGSYFHGAYAETRRLAGNSVLPPKKTGRNSKRITAAASAMTYNFIYSSIVQTMRNVLLIAAVAALMRFAYLDRIPAAVSGDELHYALTARSIVLTGRDVTGTWNPLSVFFFRYPPGEGQAELPYFLHLAAAAFPFSLFLFKLPFALLGIGSAILLYAIASSLFGPAAGFAAGLVAAVNPWLVVMNRTGYEATPATFFYLLGLYTVLKTRSWKILWSYPVFLLAFYSYIATKVIFVPFVVLTAIVGYSVRKKEKKTPYALLCILSFATVGIFLALLTTNPGQSRLGELFLPNAPQVTGAVNEIRGRSLASPLTPLFTNKLTVYGSMLSEKMLRIFSPVYLFVTGDQFFLPVQQGFFYAVDALLILFGLLSVYATKRKYAWFILLFIAIGALPQLISTTAGDFSIHLTLMFPFILLLIGIGARELARKIPWWIIAGVYILNVAGFVNVYAYQYPLTGSGDFPMRILSRYVSLASGKNVPVIMVSNRNGDFLKKYLFYTGAITPSSLQGIRIADCSAEPHAGSNQTFVYDDLCPAKPRGDVYIARLIDGGREYAIVNDRVCNGVSLRSYPTGITLADLTIEDLPAAQFCSIYISR